jgi:hypothetical protein
MRLELMTVWLVALAYSAPPTGDALKPFLPADLGRIKRTGDAAILGDGGTVVATYLDLASRKTVTVTLQPVTDVALARADFKVWGEGATALKASTADYAGFVVDGVPGGYFWTTTAGAIQSTAGVLVADQILVRVQVSPAKDPAEPTRLMKDLDLSGLRTLVP